MYEQIEDIAGADLSSIMARVHAIPAVRVAPHADTPIIRSSIEQLVRQAEEGRRPFLPA